MLSLIPTIGVLDLQGAVREHLAVLQSLSVPTRCIRLPEELEEVDGLILPGGESTTIGKLMAWRGIDNAIRQRNAQGMPIFGTCAGLILLAKRIEGFDQDHLGLLDVTVRRNAFGRQVESFEAEIPCTAMGETPVHGVFIRAPEVTECGSGVEVLGNFRNRIVAVRQETILGTSFHPELTSDSRIHAYFVRMAARFRVDDHSETALLSSPSSKT